MLSYRLDFFLASLLADVLICTNCVDLVSVQALVLLMQVLHCNIPITFFNTQGYQLVVYECISWNHTFLMVFEFVGTIR